jgi:predicted negative regulator of RcsB-dependent stress response
MAQQRIDKEELRHDAFRDSMFDAIDYLHKHLRLMIAAAVCAVVIAAGGIGYYAYLQKQAEVESAAFHDAEKPLIQPNVANDDRIKQTEAAMQGFVKGFPNSRLAPAALTYMARFAFEHKEWDKVETAYRRALAHPKIEPVQRAVVLLGLGKLKEAQGKPQEAAAFFDQIADKRFEDLKAYAGGTADLAAGKADAARKQFQLAATSQPPTVVSGWAKDALDYLP